MKDIKAYIRIPVEQELPKKDGEYFTLYGLIDFKSGTWIYQQFDRGTDEFYESEVYPDYWWKEVSLTEYMVGFAEWVDKKYVYSEFKQAWVLFDKPYEQEECFTINQLLSIYFTQKGIIFKY